MRPAARRRPAARPAVLLCMLVLLWGGPATLEGWAQQLTQSHTQSQQGGGIFRPLECPATLVLGQSVGFNGSYGNTGQVPIEGVFFRITVNDRLALTAGAASQGTWSGTAQQLLLSIGTVAPGQTVTFDLTITTAAPGTATLQTVFGQNGVEGSPESCQIEVVEQADVYVAKQASPAGKVVAGQTLTYLIAVGNAGPHPAKNVALQDVLPASVEVLGVVVEPGQATGASCAVNGQTLDCQAAQLGLTSAAPDLWFIAVQVRPTAAGTLQNQARATAQTPDPNAENNASAVVVTEVEPAMPVLSIEKTASVATPVFVGMAFTYTITVRNTGNAPSANVVMTDALPGAVNVTGVTAPAGANCALAAGTLTCALGSIAPGASVSVQIAVTARVPGDASNTARIDGGTATVQLTITEIPRFDVHGQKFLDLDGDGRKDPGEPGMNLVEIELLDAQGALLLRQRTHDEDLDGDGRIDPETEQGRFTVKDLAPGTYTLREGVPFGFVQTFPPAPGTHTFTLASGSPPEALYLFGNRLEVGPPPPNNYRFDFGDLPDPRTDSPCPPVGGGYATRLARGGPFHRIDPTGPSLGPRLDPEGDGQPDAAALGDDRVDALNTDDEDGLISAAVLASGALRFEVVARVPPGVSAFLDVWVDLDDSCSFEQLAPPLTGGLDYVLVRRPVANGANVLTTAPGLKDPADQLGYTRLRISRAGTAFPTGGAPDGEVEDYFLVGLDFGDAPGSADPARPQFPGGYPTTLAQDGARHIATASVRLGDRIDADGLANGRFDAAEDDENQPQDDEDGFTFLGGFTLKTITLGADTFDALEVVRGTQARLLPLPSTNGKLNAWVDWNRDGDWDDAGEQVFTNEDVSPQMSPNQALVLPVPADAGLGYTYARFRFNRFGNLSFQGGASEGEVEDYLLRVVESGGSTAGEVPEALPADFVVYGSYPNPFNPTTTLRFDLPERAQVRVEVVDALGRTVLVVPPRAYAAGRGHTLRVEAGALAAGVYLYRVVAEAGPRTTIRTGRMVLVK